MPYRVSTIHTHLPADEVRRRLSDIVVEGRLNPYLGSWSGPPKGPFVGTVREDSFEIIRIIRYARPFMPVVCGHLEKGTVGTDVRMRMFVGPVDAALALFIAGGLVWVTLARSWSDGLWNFAWRDLLASVALMSCMVLVAAALFYPETRKAKELIVSCLTDGWGDLGVGRADA
jgi:hypothetical protein